MTIEQMIQILKFCPFCGCGTFYFRDYATGPVAYRFNTDGSEAHNEEMYDALTIYQKKSDSGVFCENCHKKLFDRNTGKLTRQAKAKLGRRVRQDEKPFFF